MIKSTVPPLSQNPKHLTHPKYRADIDGLRAIAVLSVVFFMPFQLFLKVDLLA
jgi:peptidoglycan/LPS O-acetylase OafA/YrhL